MSVREFKGAEVIKNELRTLRDKKLLRRPVCISSSVGPMIKIKGETYTDFSSNNYLNLSANPGILKAASAALEKYGFGSGASRLLSGTYNPHKKLEEKIAAFKNTEAALVFNTGYAANTGIIPVIAGSGSVIYSDKLNHASIVDGARLSKADVRIFRHRDVDHLETLLKKDSKRKTLKQKLIVTDTVFSMDGDIAPLKELVSLSSKYEAVLMIDDAHGTGVLGKTGRGALEHFGIEGGDVIQMGTFSKALGCFGAYVAGSKDLVDLLMSSARSFMYSTSLPPVVAAACIKAVEIVDSGSVNLRKRLWKNRDRLIKGLEKLGYDTLDSETPIIPFMVGDVDNALKLSEHLYENLMFAPAIRPPTVQEDMCRIRLSVTAAHTKEDIDNLLKCLHSY